MKKSSSDKKEQGHQGDKDTSNENLMTKKILSLIFLNFNNIKMPVQNKVLREAKENQNKEPL